MNIQSISNISQPQRTNLSEMQSQPALRQASVQANPQIEDEQLKAPNAQQTQSEQNPNSPSREQVDQAVNRLAKFVAPNQSEINFSVDESSGVRLVKIIDKNSNEVIRQMPSEEAVALARALDKLQGLLIKDKA